MRCAQLIALALLVTARAVAQPSSEPFYTLVDLTDDYAAFYDRTEDMETGARVAAFKAEFERLFPGFYDTDRVKDFIAPEAYDALIADSFKDFPKLRDRFAGVAASFEASMAPARASFVGEFPDAAPIGEVYLLHSVGEMDGGTRTIRGRQLLIFGADVMATHGYDDERPFFHHELFHIYHSQFFKDCEQVWCALWSEGLAVYVAQRLNPSATDEQLLLTRPQPIRSAVDAHLAEAVCAARQRLHSEESRDRASLFRGDIRLNEALPPRFGYYVGYLAAREAGRRRSLQDLAHLSLEEAEPVVASALAALAPCPAPWALSR